MKNFQGFTLIEILIAITLLAFISLGVITVVNNSIDTKERVTFEDNEKMQILVGLSRLEWDFSHIYSPLYHGRFPDPNKAMSKVEKETWEKEQSKMQNNNNFFALSTEKLPIPFIRQDGPHELMFFMQGNRRRLENTKESEYAWVYYHLEPMEEQNEQENNKGLFALKRNLVTNNPFTSEKIEPEINNQGQVVLERIKELKFEFWDRNQKKYVSSLRDMRDVLEKNIFRSVKVSFTWVDSKGVEEIFEKTLRPLFPFFEEDNLLTDDQKPTSSTSISPINDDQNDGAGLDPGDDS